MAEPRMEEYELSQGRETSMDHNPPSPVPATDHTPLATSCIPDYEYPPYATKAMLGQYFPEVDPDHSRAKSLSRKLSNRTTMLRTQLGLATFVAIINTVVLIWATATHELDKRGVGTLFTRDCASTRAANSVAHLLINGLSTLFLGAGNYCMQLLVAPSRAELDSAHAHGDWFEIGVLSVGNLFKLPPRRAVLWLALGVISTALHLAWNATLFASVPYTIFVGAIATSDFRWAGDQWNESTTQGSVRDFMMNSSNHERIYNLQDTARNFTWLDRVGCMELYVDSLKSTSDVVIVAKNVTSAQNNGSSLIQGWINGLASWDYANFWVCAGATTSLSLSNVYCTREWMRPYADNWALVTWEAPHYQAVEVDYCLVCGQADNSQRCGFHFSAPAMGAVSICTLIGCALVLLVGRTQRDHALVTLGDAIATFLNKPEAPPPDGSSANDSLPSLLPRRGFFKSLISGRKEFTVVPRPAPWSPCSSTPWLSAVSKTRWALSYTFFLLSLSPIVVSLILALTSLSRQAISISLPGLWKEGLGRAKGSSLIGGPWESGLSLRDFTHQVLLTNGLQLLVSCAYMILNAILSRQLVADEWVRLLNPQDKKPLRVSQPVGLQQSSYTLSMPFRYSAPMMILFVLLHWLVSQAIFLVQTTVYHSGEMDVRVPDKDNSRVGFSALGIILVMVVVVILFGGTFVHSAMRKYRGAPVGFPALGVCSAAISAVCRPPKGDTDAHLFPVWMGVVERGRERRGYGAEGMGSAWLTVSTYIGLQEPRRGSIVVQPSKEKLHRGSVRMKDTNLDEEELLYSVPRGPGDGVGSIAGDNHLD